MSGSDPQPSQGSTGAKSRFDDIYDQPDPRAYFRRLAPLEYEIPHHAQPVFRQAAAERAAAESGVAAPPVVLDVCCSYGINAALLNHDMTLAELYEHYTAPGVSDLSTAELAARDKEFYAARRRPDAHRVIGLDIAGRVVRYAHAVGLLDAAFTDNLEHRPASPRLRRALASVGLITLTGGGSYITHRTFDALLSCTSRPVWVSVFVLRTVPYDEITKTLAEHSLVTTTDPTRTYPQRLFTDEQEQRAAVEAVVRLEENPAGREAAGRFHTLLHVSRPPSAT